MLSAVSARAVHAVFSCRVLHPQYGSQHPHRIPFHRQHLPPRNRLSAVEEAEAQVEETAEEATEVVEEAAEAAEEATEEAAQEVEAAAEEATEAAEEVVEEAAEETANN